MSKTAKSSIKVNNVPDNIIGKYPYWTVTLVDGEIWWYGAYNTKEECEKFNKKYNTIFDRINKQGMSIDETFKIKKERIKISNLKYKGKNYEDLKELCMEHNKNYIEVYNKLKENYSLEYSLESTNCEYIEEL